MTSIPEILSTGLEIGSLYLVESKCSPDAKMSSSSSVVGLFWLWVLILVKLFYKLNLFSAFAMDLGIWKGECFCEWPNKRKI